MRVMSQSDPKRLSCRIHDEPATGEPSMDTEEAPQGFRLWDLRTRSCRWPLGGTHEHAEFFCGATTVPGCPYCQEHSKRAFARAAAPGSRADKKPPLVFKVRQR